MSKTILVSGGAGYIGSHLIKNLLKEGFFVVVVDNLSSGFIEPIEIIRNKYVSKENNLEFIKGDLNDRENLDKIFSQRKIDIVMHLAAKTNVIESIQKPSFYNQENYVNSVNLIDAMTAHNINKIIFSSTAAVYGDPKYTPIDEAHSTSPLNPYAQTKLDFEKYLSKIRNLKYTVFRYFNVGGADLEGNLGKSHLESQDLMENIMKVALGQKEFLSIYGNDFETSDGTPIRDFVHVEDISFAHVLAIKKIDQFEGGQIFNLGSQNGFSVKEIINQASLIINRDLPIKNEKRRQGEIAISVTSIAKAKNILGWEPQHSDICEIIQTDWNWRKNHPKGYIN